MHKAPATTLLWAGITLFAVNFPHVFPHIYKRPFTRVGPDVVSVSPSGASPSPLAVPLSIDQRVEVGIRSNYRVDEIDRTPRLTLSLLLGFAILYLIVTRFTARDVRARAEITNSQNTPSDATNPHRKRTVMAAAKHHRSTVRSFERANRIPALLDAGIIRSPDEIPADAIPARPEFVERCRPSLRAHHRPPYYRDQQFTCTDCQQQVTWKAEEQRFWYEQLHGSIYSEAARRLPCRKQRKGTFSP